MASIVWSKYLKDNSSKIESGVIWSGIPYYLGEEKYWFIEQVKSMIDCVILNYKNKK